MDADEHLVVRGHRHRHLTEFEDVGAAVAFVDDRLHRGLTDRGRCVAHEHERPSRS